MLLISIIRIILAVSLLSMCITALLIGKPKQRTYAHLSDSSDDSILRLNMWETSIGRNPSNDIVLEYDTVSRFHAVIARRRDGWYIFSVNDNASISVNGNPVNKLTTISSGDVLGFGPVCNFVFVIDNDPIIIKRKSGKKNSKTPHVDDTVRRVRTDSTYTYKTTSHKRGFIATNGHVYPLFGTIVKFGDIRGIPLKANTGKIEAIVQLYDDGTWVIENVGGGNVYLNGRAVLAPQYLIEGDKVTIYEETFTYSELL